MDTTQNRLISLLPPADSERLVAACTSVELSLSELLCERDELTTHVYFPTSAFISLISLADARAGVELGMIGREGMLGAHLCLSVFKSPLRAVVQGAGQALRIPADEFIDHMQASSALRHVIQRFEYVLTAQQATSAACLRFHQIDQRLARWLLTSQDSAPRAFLQVTQEFLAYMLGVRRVGTAVATSSLLREGIIEYRHGQIRVIDRDRLKQASCSCYASDRRSYDMLFGKSHEEDRRAGEDCGREISARPPSDVPLRAHQHGTVDYD
jgi:CRP-like cAMP-binding protein